MLTLVQTEKHMKVWREKIAQVPLKKAKEEEKMNVWEKSVECNKRIKI